MFIFFFAGEQTFQRVYRNPSDKKISAPSSTSAGVCQEQLQETGADKRRRRAPCDWWVVANQVEGVSPLPQPQQVKPVRGRVKTRQNKALGLGSPKNGNVAVSSKPPGGAPGPARKVKLAGTKKAVKRSLAPFMDCVPTAVGTPSKASMKVSALSSEQEVRMPEAQDASKTDTGEANRLWGDLHSRHQSDNTWGYPTLWYFHNCSHRLDTLSVNLSFLGRSEVIRSGPSSMIQLEDYQDNDMSMFFVFFFSIKSHNSNITRPCTSSQNTTFK